VEISSGLVPGRVSGPACRSAVPSGADPSRWIPVVWEPFGSLQTWPTVDQSLGPAICGITTFALDSCIYPDRIGREAWRSEPNQRSGRCRPVWALVTSLTCRRTDKLAANSGAHGLILSLP
jgi:hypothetical protein